MLDGCSALAIISIKPGVQQAICW